VKGAGWKGVVARAAGRASRLSGRGGTSIPGKVLLRLDPGAIGRLATSLDRRAAISATNGKTTTAAMAAAILERGGADLVANTAGANMAGGIASTLLSQRGDTGLFEVDEFWLPSVVGGLRPDALLLANLFRDQLDRYGELESIADRWAQVVRDSDPATTLVLNADDPLVADLGRERSGVVFFGVEDVRLAQELQHASDSTHCRRCGAPYRYDAIFLGHQGHYHCEACGATRPTPDVTAADVRLDGTRGSRFRLTTPAGSSDVALPLPGLYNVYNALAAAALTHALGASLADTVAGLEAVAPAFGRAETVHVGGRDVTHAPPEQRGVVYLQQTPMLFPHLSVIDNVGFPLEVRGVARAAARAKAGELLERVHLSNLSHRAAHALSGGQRHRVALARALAADPAVLLLDEPFNALDPALRSDVRDAVFTMLARESGPSVVVVTHDVDEAAALAGRLAILIDGAIAQDAPPASLLARPATLAVARFLGLPNIVRGSSNHGMFQCMLGTFPGTAADGPCALVARPDAFTVYAVGGTGNGTALARSVRVRVRVIEIRERVSGTLVVVRVVSELEGHVHTEIVAQRGDAQVHAGQDAVMMVADDRVHIVSDDETTGAPDV